MVEQYSNGDTLEVIGARFGVTRERVRQIVKKIGGVDAEAARERRSANKSAAEGASRAAFMQEFGALAEQLAERGYTREVAVGRLTAAFPHVDGDVAEDALRESSIVFAQVHAGNHFSIPELQAGLWFLAGSNERLSPDYANAALDLPAELLEAVPLALEDVQVTPEEMATILGVIAAARVASAEGRDLTIAGSRYEELRLELVSAMGLVSAQGQTPWPPTRQTLMKRFGGWNEALESIGLALATKGRGKGLVVYTEAEYLEAITLHYADALSSSRKPTFADYGDWVVREKQEGRRRPSTGAVRLQFGSWLDALRIARSEVNRQPDIVEVGATWSPLVSTLVALNNGLSEGQYWVMNTHRFATSAASPYAQAILQDDGSIGVEVYPSQSLAQLVALGWFAPDAGSPNSYRVYDKGWNAVTVANDVIHALVAAHDFTLDDLVSFSGKAEQVHAYGTLTHIGEDIFAIETPTTQVPSLPETDLPDSIIPPTDDYDTALEIMARLIEAGVVESVGEPLETPVGPSKRQGVSYQHSGYSDSDIVGWFVDVTSWPTAEEADWVAHVNELGGTAPLILMTGVNWAVTVRAGQGDSDVPGNLVETLRSALPGGVVQWSHGHDAEWFEPRFRTTASISEELRSAGLLVNAVGTRAELDPYLLESLGDDTFGFARVRVEGGPSAVVAILIDNNWAENAADAFSGYLRPGPDSSTIAGDGWVVRVVQCESIEVDADEYAQQLAEALDATYASSPFVDVARPESQIDTSLWGPQAHQMSSMLNWASRYVFAVPQEQWDDDRLLSWKRITAALETAGRFEGSLVAESLMGSISTNDFFDHTGVEALRALAARDLISVEDYDEFTLPWRRQVGRIHPDDAEVAFEPYSDTRAYSKHPDQP